MPDDRRNFLKMFGLTTAIVPVVTDLDNGDIHQRMEIAKCSEAVPVKDRQLAPYKGYEDAFEVNHQYLYSSLTLNKETPLSTRGNHAPPGYELFRYNSTEQAGPADTNVWRSGRLDAPCSYAVSKIGVLFSPDTDLSTRNDFANRFAIVFWLGQRIYFRAPIASLFGVGNPINNVDGPSKGFAELEVPIIIQNNMTFHVSLVGTPKDSDRLKLWVILGNLYARGWG